MNFDRMYSSYQMVHLLKLRSNGMNGILISDGVGVGKTISAGYIIEYTIRVMKQHVLVCCPPVLEQKWIEELHLRFGRRAYSVKADEDFNTMVDENTPSSTFEPSVYVLPYSTARNRKISEQIRFGAVVFDEVHHARNQETALFSKLVKLAKQSKYRIGLSATPIHNEINDLSTIFGILFPKYGTQIWQYVINELWGRKKVEILHPLLTKFDKTKLGIHFTKRSVYDVEIDLPASYHRFVEATLDKKGIERGKELTSFERMIYLRMASSSPAAFFNSIGRDIPDDYEDHKLAALSNLIIKNSAGRWLIFTEFRKTAQSLAAHLSELKPSILSGDTKFGERYLAIDDFRKDETGVVIMLPVGCEGLDLQVCSRLINYDLHWNPMVIEQRVGRIDRIGQKKTEVEIYNFIITGSLDLHMQRIMKQKIGLVSNTFADVDALIGDDLHHSSLATEIFENLPETNGLAILSKLDQSLPQVDYRLSELLSDELCDVGNWPTEVQDWDVSFSVSGLVEVERILSKIRTSSFDLLSILSDYL